MCQYLVLISIIIHIVLALRQQGEFGVKDGGGHLELQYSIDMLTPERMIGAIFYNETCLLVYTTNMIAIVSLQNDTRPVYKYIQNFQPRKLAKGFTESNLLLLSDNWHCVRQLHFPTRQITTFSGSCLQPGFIDGDKINARYNSPKDLQKVGDSFYVADYNNDCIRRLWNNGNVRKLISIHSKPFELSGNLFVAAQRRVYQEGASASLLKVKVTRSTYVSFVDDVDVKTMESCSPEGLAMLTEDKCLRILPLSRDVSLHPASIDGPFDSLICEGENTLVIKLLSTATRYTSMQIYSVNISSATGKTTPTSTSTAEISTTQATSTTSKLTASSITSSTVLLTSDRSFTNASASNQTTSIILSSSKYNTTARRGEDILPLHNHAHLPFDHLPKSYTEANGSWKVVLPVVLAALTIVAVLAVLACIITKRSGGRSEEAEEHILNETSQSLLPLEIDVNTTRHFKIDCRKHHNKTNGHTSHSSTNGCHSNGTTFIASANGVALPDLAQHSVSTHSISSSDQTPF